MSDKEDEVDPTAGDFDDFAEEEEPSAIDDSDDEAVADDDDADADVEYESLPPTKAKQEQSNVIEVLPPDEMMTSDFLSPIEVAAVLACRAEQLEDSDPFLPPGVVRTSHDPVEIAKQELRCGLCPLIIQRKRSHGNKLVIEERAVRDLQLPFAL